MHEYDAALYYVTSIPECCAGYEEASKLIDTYYTQYVNYNCQLIMQYADPNGRSRPMRKVLQKLWTGWFSLNREAVVKVKLKLCIMK